MMYVVKLNEEKYLVVKAQSIEEAVHKFAKHFEWYELGKGVAELNVKEGDINLEWFNRIKTKLNKKEVKE